jgi:hypothetical protein
VIRGEEERLDRDQHQERLEGCFSLLEKGRKEKSDDQEMCSAVEHAYGCSFDRCSPDG